MSNGTEKKIDSESWQKILELARESYSFASRFKRTKLIVTLLFGGGLFAIGLSTMESSAEFSIDCFQLSVWVAIAYIAGQALVDGLEKLKG